VSGFLTHIAIGNLSLSVLVSKCTAPFRPSSNHMSACMIVLCRPHPYRYNGGMYIVSEKKKEKTWYQTFARIFVKY